MTRALVFDSGVGGLSVLDAMCAAGCDWTIDYVSDNAWLPYGEKADADLIARVPALLAGVAAAWEPDVIVIACNTASTIALEATRARLPMPIVGVVPPIKPAAAATRTGAIAVLATPATIRRAYTHDLIAQFASQHRVVRVGSTALVSLAERKLRGEEVSVAEVAAALAPVFAGPDGADVDVVALSCTHFPLLLDELRAAAPREVTWLHSGPAVARRAAEVAHVRLGVARVRRAGLTAPADFERLRDAFAHRGFDAFAAVRATAPFDVDVWRERAPA